MNDHHHPLYGVLLILLSGLLLASHDGLAKHLSEIYPVSGHLGPLRGAGGADDGAVRAAHGAARVSHPAAWPQLLRGLSLVSVSLLFINGLHFIPRPRRPR